ncbi:MAG TPA: thiamine ABC transporter substrate-binding protein [Desulfobacteraceae bacterium]|nr:thiamine ABC transporter substrate-binding protein [Desulfobacteraceae bacterium]|tara:strand:+ start:87 stop:1190 length:1104 start_codon:yes stop_codon:yes gene_type:complete
MNFKWISVLLLAAVLMCGGCAGDEPQHEKAGSETAAEQAAAASGKPAVLTIMTHDSFSVSKPVLAAFESAIGARVTILKSGDAGEALNKAILSRNNPLADIFYGVDNTFLSRALKTDVFVPYAPKGLENVGPALRLDPENRLIPVDYGDVCLNYDIAWFKDNNLAPPAMLEDLVKPAYKGLTVVQNPATSSPGLAFLLATVSRFGEDGYLGYWRDLKTNEVLVKNGWKEAYWGEFTAASEGSRPIVVSYASSPAAEVLFADPTPAEAPTGVVIGHGAAFRQVEFAGILAGGKQTVLAKKAMDFLLSRTFQEDIPLQMFVFPVNIMAALPEVFEVHARITKEPSTLDPERISRRRDTWIREWTDTVLQ